MAEGEIPSYIYRSEINEEAIGKAMVKLLADFNIHGLDEAKALRLFYSILAHFMYFLDVHPGQYFHLKYIDIASDKHNFLKIVRNHEYAEDTVTPTTFYNKFCGSEALMEEFRNTVDLFTSALLGIKIENNRKRITVDELIKQKNRLLEERKKIDKKIKRTKEQRQQITEQRKKDAKKIKHDILVTKNRAFSNQLDIYRRNKTKSEYLKLKEELTELWNKDNTQFPF